MSSTRSIEASVDRWQRVLDRRLHEGQPRGTALASVRDAQVDPHARRDARRRGPQEARIVAAPQVEDPRRRRLRRAAQHGPHRQRDAEAVDRAEPTLAVHSFRLAVVWTLIAPAPRRRPSICRRSANSTAACSKPTRATSPRRNPCVSLNLASSSTPAGRGAGSRRVLRDRDVGEAVDHRVADLGDRALDDRLARPAAALGVDDVVAVTPLGEHLDEQLGRVLEVAVHHDDGVARTICSIPASVAVG